MVTPEGEAMGMAPTTSIPVDLVWPILVELVYVAPDHSDADGAVCLFCYEDRPWDGRPQPHTDDCIITKARDILNLDQERAIAALLAHDGGGGGYDRDAALRMLGI